MKCRNSDGSFKQSELSAKFASLIKNSRQQHEHTFANEPQASEREAPLGLDELPGKRFQPVFRCETPFPSDGRPSTRRSHSPQGPQGRSMRQTSKVSYPDRCSFRFVAGAMLGLALRGQVHADRLIPAVPENGPPSRRTGIVRNSKAVHSATVEGQLHETPDLPLRWRRSRSCTGQDTKLFLVDLTRSLRTMTSRSTWTLHPRGKEFQNEKPVETAFQEFVESRRSELFRDGMRMLVSRWQMRVHAVGGYFN